MRVMLYGGAVFLVSLICAVFIPVWACFIVIALSVLGVVLFSLLKKPHARKAVVICFFLAAALSVYLLKTYTAVKPLEAYDGKEVLVIGMVEEGPKKTAMGYSYVLEIDSVNGENQSGKMRLYSSGFMGDRGDIVKIIATVEKIENTVYYTERFYSFGKGIFLTGETASGEIIGRNDLRGFFYDVADRVSLEISEHLPEREGDLLAGILLNDKEKLSNLDHDILSNAGYSHLINVSGLHMTMVSAIMFLILRKLLFGERRIASLLSVLGVIFYIILTGFSVSAIRAGVMLSVYYIGYALDRESDPLNSLGFSVVLILLFNPFAAYDMSLLLSVFSTFGIIYVSFNIRELYESEKIGLKLYRVLMFITPSISAVIFTAPVIMLSYGRINLVSIISNMALFIFITPTVYLGLALALSGIIGIPVLTEFLAFLARLCAKSVFFLAEFFSRMDFLRITAAGTVSKIIAVIVILFLPVLFSRLLNRRKKILSLAILSVLIVSVGMAVIENIYRNRPAFYILSEGDNYCYIYGTEGEYYLFGADTASMASSAASFLEACGEERLHFMYVSSNNLYKKNAAKEINSRLPIENSYADSEETRLSLWETYGIESVRYRSSEKLQFTGADMVTIINDKLTVRIDLSEDKAWVAADKEEGVFYLAKSDEKVYYSYNGLFLSSEDKPQIYRVTENGGEILIKEVKTLGTDNR